MTQKELMLNGDYYDASDKQLKSDRIKAKKLCKLYNNLDIDDIPKKKEIIKELLAV